MANILADVKIDSDLMYDAELSLEVDDNSDTKEALAAVVNNFFSNFEVPGKTHTFVAGVDEDDSSKIYVAAVDKADIEEMADADESWVNKKDTIASKATVMVAFEVSSSWNEDIWEDEYELPARHSAQEEPEHASVQITANELSVTLDNAEIIIPPQKGMENVTTALVGLEKSSFVLGSIVEEDFGKSRSSEEQDFRLEDNLPKQIGGSFGKAAYGTSQDNVVQMEKVNEPESLDLAI